MASPISAVSPLPRNEAPAVAPAGWETALANIASHGTLADYGQFGTYKGIEQTEGSRDGTHQRYFAGQFGFVDTAGQFHGGNTQIIAEDWQLRDDGRYYVDIWRHIVSPQGELLRSEHAYLVENQNGRVFDSGSRPMQPGEAAANLTSQMPRWVTFTPPASLRATDVTGEEPGREAARGIAPQAPLRGDGLKPGGGGVSLR
ncbi:MAG: hypothetical protein ACAI38_16680 [Myxococcota bacterium]|nr:hypothetical protein [Myxococcota bacterium]